MAERRCSNLYPRGRGTEPGYMNWDKCEKKEKRSCSHGEKTSFKSVPLQDTCTRIPVISYDRCVAVYCSVLRCIAVCCGVLQWEL